jgi:hypothetical protein
MSGLRILASASLLFVQPLAAQGGFFQTQTDDYTRYELLEPETHSFRIIYDVSATTAGAPYYFNGLRVGSLHVIHGAYDLASGAALPWEIVGGAAAREMGMENARDGAEYLAVSLARSVPTGGQARVRIDKTYRDSASYFAQGDLIWFDRPLGIKRNSVLLPDGFELLESNYPSQVVTEESGRIKVSFMNSGPAEVPFRVRGRRRSVSMAPAMPVVEVAPASAEPQTQSMTVPSGARLDYEFSERAFQDRDITYFLQGPETNSFRLFHDYTETRPGMDRYVNVVRAGSKATKPSALNLDTGEQLQVETLRGSEISARGIDIGRKPDSETEVVVIWFDPVQTGHSVRLRIEETYTDPSRYLLTGGELVWDRSFGRPRNTVILPFGWYITSNAAPGVVTETEDGRIRVRYVNDSPGNVNVFLKARRR